MVTYTSGPFNIEQGNSAYFTIEFLDSTGALTVPSSADLTITYINTVNASQVDTVALTQTNSFFTGTWSSTSAALGLASWLATCAGSTITQSVGQIRVLQRQSTY